MGLAAPARRPVSPVLAAASSARSWMPSSWGQGRTAALTLASAPRPPTPRQLSLWGLVPRPSCVMWVCSEFWACYRPFQSSSSYVVHLLRPPVSLCLTLPSLPSQLEEKARLEAEARARGHLHLREEQRRRADDERLTEELQRLQELQTLRAVKKKKKERLGKDCPKLDMLASSFQAAAESAPGAETIHNGSLEPTEDPETSSPCPSRHADHAGPGPGADPSRHADPTEPVDAREAKRLLPKGISGEQPEPLSFLLDMVHHHKGGAGPQKPRPGSKAAGEPARKPGESPRAPEGPARPRPQAEPKARVLELPPLVGHRREETKANSNNSNRKQLNHVREEKPGPGPAEPPVPSEPLQSGKPATAESPQPKGRGRKSKKKKGERASSSIGECGVPHHRPQPCSPWARAGFCLGAALPAQGHVGTVATSGCREVASQPPSCGKSARTPRTPRSAVTLAPSSWPPDCVSAPGEGCFAVFPLYVPVCVSFSEGPRFWTTGQWLEAGHRRRTGHPLPRRPEPHSCCSVCPVASFKGKLVSPGVGPSRGPLSVPLFLRPRLCKECGPSMFRMNSFLESFQLGTVPSQRGSGCALLAAALCLRVQHSQKGTVPAWR